MQQREAARRPRDAFAKTVRVLAEVRRQNLSAYKVEMLVGLRRGTAQRLLALAEEHGFIKRVGETRKGRPVYGWRQPWE